MEIRKLRRMGGNGSAGVALPKPSLEADGIVSSNGIDDDTYAKIERIDDGSYLLHLIGTGE